MMGFNPTFYAGRPKLSQVTIDSDLNMGGRDISGVDTLRVDTLQAGRVDSPYMPQTWPTVELDWGDVPPSEVVIREAVSVPNTGTTIGILTPESPTEVSVRVTVLESSKSSLGSSPAIRVNEVDVHSLAGLSPGSSTTTPPRILKAGDVLTAYLSAATLGGATAKVELLYTGRFVQGRTFDLTGKWLALGIDMHGLAATVKIQGVEMPYSDYAKYFPLAPSELTIPGDWSPFQARPIVKVYV